MADEQAYVPQGYCPGCGYRIDPGRCPECGREVRRPWKVRPRVVALRRVRWAAAALVLLGLGVAAWRYGPGLAARYLPDGALVWIWETDVLGADWAGEALRVRMAQTFAAHTFDDAADYALLRTKAEQTALPAAGAAMHDWAGKYECRRTEFRGRSTLSLTDGDVLWDVDGTSFGTTLRGRVAGLDEPVLRLDFPAGRRLLRWARYAPGGRAAGLDSQLVLVRWGEWRFLVPPDELLTFCNDVNSQEPLSDQHLIRYPPTVSEHEHLRGRPFSAELPQVPAPYDGYLVAAPLELSLRRSQALTLDLRRTSVDMLRDLKKMAGVEPRAYLLELETKRPEAVFEGMRVYAQQRMGMGHVVGVRGGVVRVRYVELAAVDARGPPAGMTLSTQAPPARVLDGVECAIYTRQTSVRPALGVGNLIRITRPAELEHSEPWMSDLRFYWLLRNLALEVWGML